MRGGATALLPLHRREHKPSERGGGETGFLHAPARGRVWEGAARTQGDGKPGFPIPSPGGRVWEGAALPTTTLFIAALCATRTTT